MLMMKCTHTWKLRSLIMCGNTVSILIFITVFFRLYDGHSKKNNAFCNFLQTCYSTVLSKLLLSIFSIQHLCGSNTQRKNYSISMTIKRAVTILLSSLKDSTYDMRLEMVGVPTLEHKSKISDLIAKYGDDGFRNTGQKWFVILEKRRGRGHSKTVILDVWRMWKI